jgi:hypothetical protein
MAWLKVIIPLLIFLHGSLMAPLHVECISQDGSCLIEIIGQDPCHERPAVPTGPADGGTTLTGMLHQVDTCTDLMMDGAAELKVCCDYSIAPQQVCTGLPSPSQLPGEPEWSTDPFHAPRIFPLPCFPLSAGVLRI